MIKISKQTLKTLTIVSKQFYDDLVDGIKDGAYENCKQNKDCINDLKKAFKEIEEVNGERINSGN